MVPRGADRAGHIRRHHGVPAYFRPAVGRTAWRWSASYAHPYDDSSFMIVASTAHVTRRAAPCGTRRIRESPDVAWSAAHSRWEQVTLTRSVRSVAPASATRSTLYGPASLTDRRVTCRLSPSDDGDDASSGVSARVSSSSSAWRAMTERFAAGPGERIAAPAAS